MLSVTTRYCFLVVGFLAVALTLGYVHAEVPIPVKPTMFFS
jgi:hypothetical protein